MCGIAGLWAPGGLEAESPAQVARRMADVLAHRGPDDGGIWADDEAGIALGHRRLSVVDLSPQGHQPMSSADGRWTLAFNGEIYNYPQLRRDLEAQQPQRWRGSSDTEVVLAALSRWGLEATLARLVGMFAIALWDHQERRLHLVRDRMGEKPLYYAWVKGVLLFGSELKALRAHPGWLGELDRDAVALYLRYGYVPEPHAIYRGAAKLPAGAALSVDAAAARAGLPAPWRYWDPAAVVQESRRHAAERDAVTTLERLDELLREAVAGQMVADVPVGAFLSGGIDSSLIVALMQAQNTRPVRTYTIGFHEDEYDEADYARAVARHLGTDHTELYVSPREALDVIPSLPVVYDEPLGDPSQIPTILVSRLARRDVTVCLSGDGGDELFGGYTRYDHAWRQWRWTRSLPAPLRRGLNARLPRWDGRLGKIAQVITAPDRVGLYRRTVSQCAEALQLVPGAREPRTVLTDDRLRPPCADFHAEMMWLDAVSYLPGDILVKVDRAAMSTSLETRVPLLDHRIVEFAWSLPFAVTNRDGRGKWPLRALLERYAPASLFDRPKKGFGVPIARWLREDLREWAEDLLSPTRLREEGVFAPELVRRRWEEHRDNRVDRRFYLWNVLMFQAWLATQSASASERQASRAR